MKHQIKIFCGLLSLLVFTVACSKKSDSSSTAAQTISATTVVVTPSAALLAYSGTTAVSVTGGSGTYVSVVASEGTIVPLGVGLYLYTAPASSANTYITITVTDSTASVGFAYLTISSGISSASAIQSCAGTYDAKFDDLNATLYLLGDTASQVTGYIYMLNYYYPVIGTCTVGGALSLTNVSLNQQITATVSLTIDSHLQISSGVLVATNASQHPWSALSRDLVKMANVPISSCEGTYAATIGANTGTIVLVDDGNHGIAGYLTLQGYYYTLAGTCYGAGGSVSFNNLTTGSPYSGMVSATGQMSGTFTTSAGGSYNWSASK